MLRDAERDSKFYEALRRRVTAGSKVLDIGAGTGVWAIAAAKLGASLVVAIEMDELLVGVIRMLAKEHGVAGRIEAICASSFEVELRREFDVVISETIGYLGYDERIVEVMADARKRFLRDGGSIIPETVSLYAAAGRLNIRTERVPVGVDFDFDALARLNLNSPRVLKRPRDVTLLTRPKRLIATDLRKVERTPSLHNLTTVWENAAASSSDLRTRAENIDCVVVWVESRLASGVNLSTRRRTTSWYPTVYRIEPASRPFQRMEFNLSLTPETNYWTASFVDGDNRESGRYSPEFAATEMIAAARGVGVTTDRGTVVLSNERWPPSVIDLREARPDDAEFLRKLYHSTRKDEVASFGWPAPQQESFLTMQFTAQQASYKMQYPNAEHSIILCDSTPAGRIMIDRSGDDVMLTDIAILPDFRNRGIASTLIDRLKAESRGIVLSVDKQNGVAYRLYQKHGFVVTGENEFMFTMRREAGS